MLLKPDAGIYFSLLQLAGRGVSFDGMSWIYRSYRCISSLTLL